MPNLKNKIAVVTGGGSGIGKSICKTFADNGAEVMVLDNIEEAGKATVEEIGSFKGKAAFHYADVTHQAGIMKLFEDIYREKKGLHILVNNAGIAHIGTVETTEEEDFDKVYQVNVKGVYNCLKAAVPLMKRSGGGVILNMASIASSSGLPDRFAYSMSKGAVLTMTYSVAVDFVDDNIRCNCISPARIHTPFVDNFLAKNYPGKEKEMFEALSKTQPIGRMGTPKEVADLASYLCSEEAAFITGTDFPIDGGFLKLKV